MKKFHFSLAMVLVSIVSALALTSCGAKYDEAFVVDVMNRQNSDSYESEQLLTQFKIKQDSRKFDKYDEFKYSLLNDPAFYERHASETELWPNYTKFITEFPAVYEAERYGFYDFPSIDDETYKFLYDNERPENSFLETVTNMTDLENKRLEFWLYENRDKILENIAVKDLEKAKKALESNNFEKAASLYYLVKNEDRVPSEEIDSLLEKARNYADANKKESSAAIYEIIKNLDEYVLKADDLYNLVTFKKLPKDEKDRLFVEVYNKYEQEGVTEGEKYQHAKKVATRVRDMEIGYEKYGGNYTIYQIDNRLTHKALRKSDIWPAYSDQMQKLTLNRDGSINTYSRAYRNFFWEYSSDYGFAIYYYDIKKDEYIKKGGINSQGYLTINSSIVLSSMRPTMAAFYFTKDN